MAVYLSLMMLTVIAMLLYTNFGTGIVAKKNEKGAILVYGMLVLLLILVQSLRADTVGGDLLNYKRSFYEFGNMNWSTLGKVDVRYELGYVYLNKLVYLITDGDFQWLMVVVAVFYNLALYRFLYKYSDNCILSMFLAICLGLFNISMNNLRSSLALAVIYFALPFLVEKKYVKFLISIIIASLFHTTVICFAPLLILCMIKNKKTCGFILGGIFLFFSLGFDFFSRIIVSFFPRFSLYLNYTNGGGETLIVFLGVIAIICLFFPNKKIWDDEKNIIMFKCLLYAICLQCVALRISYFARVVTYNYVSVLILLPSVIKYMKLKKTIVNRLIVLFIMVIVFSLFYYLTLQQDGTQTLEYKSIIFK